jgi:hypothetical protein
MAVLIDEAYFQRLLNDNANANESVSTLSRFWANRLDEKHEMLGVAPAELHVQSVLVYTGEVGNGGHTQLFYNRGGRLVATFARGLEQLAARSKDPTFGFLSRALQQAIGVIGTPSTLAKTRRVVERIDDEQRSDLSELLDAVNASATLVDRALLLYMRAHAEELLRPERGLIAVPPASR